MPREDKRCATCKGSGEVDAGAYSKKSCDDCEGTGAAKRDSEREQIEWVFGLTGGELAAENDPWIVSRDRDALPAPAVRYWHEGVPEYASRDFDTYESRYRTIITQQSAPPALYDEQGKWVFQNAFTSSGETECPEKQNEDTEGVVQGDENCPLCDEEPGEEHGYIYIGDGWQEAVYRLVDTQVIDGLNEMFTIVAEAIGTNTPLDDAAFGNLKNGVWDEIYSMIPNNPKAYRVAIVKTINDIDVANDTWVKRCSGSSPPELCLRARTIFAEAVEDFAKAIEAAAKKMYGRSGDDGDEVVIPAWTRVAHEFVTDLKKAQEDLRKRGKAALNDLEQRFRKLETSEDDPSENLVARRKAAEWASRTGNKITASSDLPTLLSWLRWNDPNGNYVTEEQLREEAKQAYREARKQGDLEDDESESVFVDRYVDDREDEIMTLDDAWDELIRLSESEADHDDLVKGGAAARGRLLEMNPNDFESAKARRDLLERESVDAGVALKRFPKGPTGLTPDRVKATPEWRAAKARYDKAFSDLQKFNVSFTRRFAKDLQNERRRR